MYSWFYGGSPLVVYPLVALFLFIAVFLAVLVRTWILRPAAGYDSDAAMPLDGGEHFVTTDRGVIK